MTPLNLINKTPLEEMVIGQAASDHIYCKDRSIFEGIDDHNIQTLQGKRVKDVHEEVPHGMEYEITNVQLFTKGFFKDRVTSLLLEVEATDSAEFEAYYEIRGGKGLGNDYNYYLIAQGKTDDKTQKVFRLKVDLGDFQFIPEVTVRNRVSVPCVVTSDIAIVKRK